mgnify:FL=1
MKKWMLVLLVAVFVLPVSQEALASSRKKKKATVEKKETTPAQTEYDKLLKKPGKVTATSNFITLHKLNGKLYFEIPLKYLGREMLLASTLTETSNDLIGGTVGYKQQDPLHVRFVMGDSCLYLKSITTSTTVDPNNDALQSAVNRSFSDAIVGGYKILTYNNDRSAVVIDMTDLFTTDVKDFSFLPSLGVLTVKGDFRKDASGLDEIKSFDDNVVVKSYMSYKVSVGFWIITLLSDVPVTGKVTRSLVLLPENKMRPRISDSRMAIFNTRKQHVSTKEDGIQQYSLANRWRLEPKDMAAYQRGELVEPIKPIVWYVDDAFPAEWVGPVKKAILSWNKAFEAIGFKNVMQVRDFPKDDPEFDPDNIKYTCIRYLPSTTENAMGPSWVDPTTGEIVNATVLIYNDVIKLVNNWRFVQTAQIDPRVRAKKLSKEVMEESMTYIVAHEIGHTLGFMHNMAASASYPVDSLRSASFTQKYGTTPCIMDYARFNYVAQPGDKGVRLCPPELGIYDYFLIKWNYQPIPQAKDMWEEQATLESWVDEKAGDPRFRYGRQQILSRYDPSAIEEDLGDDPIKASTYGIKNLKYILPNLEQWIENDADYSHRADLYKSIANQYFRYITNVSYNVGGIYLTEIKEGTPGERYVAVPKDVQKASLAWLLNEYRNADWLSKSPLLKKFPMGVDMTTVLRTRLAGNLTKLKDNVILSAYIASNPYTVKEFLNDLYNGAFASAIKGTKLTDGDKLLQGTLVDLVIAPLADKKESGGLFSLNAAYAPSLDEILAYDLDPSGLVGRFEDQLQAIENEHGAGFIASQLRVDEFGTPGYGFLQKVDTKAIDNSTVYLIDLAFKAQKLVNSKLATSTGEDRLHYQALAAKINKTLKNNK